MLFLSVNDILNALEVTWKGVLAIFIAVGIIYLFIIAMNKLTNIKSKKKK